MPATNSFRKKDKAKQWNYVTLSSRQVNRKNGGEEGGGGGGGVGAAAAPKPHFTENKTMFLQITKNKMVITCLT